MKKTFLIPAIALAVMMPALVSFAGTLAVNDRAYYNTVFNIPFRVPDCKVAKSGCFRLKDVPVDKIRSTFAADDYIYVGSSSGAMWKCPYNTADECEHLNQAGSAIETIFVQGRTIYAGTGGGTMWKCPTDKKNSCEDLNKAGSAIRAIYVQGDTVYAGTDGGTMWKCPADRKNRCENLNKAGSAIKTIVVDGDTIFAGTGGGTMWKCPTDKKNSCEDFNKAGSAIETLQVVGDIIYAGTGGGTMWKCPTYKKNSCTTVFSADHKTKAIYASGADFSALIDGRHGEEVITSNDTKSGFEKHIRQKNVQPDLIDKHKVEECPVSRLSGNNPLKLSNLNVAVLNYNKWKGKIADNLKGACPKGTEIVYVVALQNGEPQIYFLEICVDSRNIPLSRGYFYGYNYVEIVEGDNCQKGSVGKNLRFVHSMFVGNYTSPSHGTIEGLVLGAGEVEIEHGEISLINNCSGHYKPGKEFLKQSKEYMERYSKIPVAKNVKIKDCG